MKVTNDTLVCFDFDHIDPSTKIMGVSTLIYKKPSIERLEQEIAKCELRCASCHRLRTAKQFNYPASHKPVMKLIKPEVVTYCIDCKNPVVTEGAQRCGECAHMDDRKVKNRPDMDQLKLDFKELKTYRAVGKKYDISDNSIRKWIDSYENDLTLEDIQYNFKCPECQCTIRRGEINCFKCYVKLICNFRPSSAQLIEDYKLIVTHAGVGRKYAVSEDKIRYWMSRPDKPKTRTVLAVKPTVEQLKKDYESHGSYSAVARFYQVDPKTIRTWMTK